MVGGGAASPAPAGSTLNKTAIARVLI